MIANGELRRARIAELVPEIKRVQSAVSPTQYGDNPYHAHLMMMKRELFALMELERIAWGKWGR